MQTNFYIIVVLLYAIHSARQRKKMLDTEIEFEKAQKNLPEIIQHSFHHTYYTVYEKLKKWLNRFLLLADSTVFKDLNILYLQASKKFLDPRSPIHLFHLILSLNYMQKKLLQSATFFPHERKIEIRWMPATLSFPFSTRPVIGCLIGFNVLHRYEVFDEENVLLTLQKYVPEIRLIKESTYCHALQFQNLKLFYLEFEKKDTSAFSLSERILLKSTLVEKVKNSVQTLCPSTFMDYNEEEIYKNILTLRQEIHSAKDIAQVHISIHQQTGKEIVFRILLVYVTPNYPISFQERFCKCSFVSERILTIKHLEGHPVEAHIFLLHLPREASLLRTDGSLDFYASRQKIATLLKEVIGEFRDYNGGMIIKQREQLDELKRHFPEICNTDPELIEAFFYTLKPVERQVILPQKVLFSLFSHYIQNNKEGIFNENEYSIKIEKQEQDNYLLVHGNHPSLIFVLSSFVKKPTWFALNFTYNILNSTGGIFFNCVFLDAEITKFEAFIQDLKETLQHWQQKMQERKVLRIALEFSLVSLDPRIGGDVISGDFLRFLFQGLTRLNCNGNVENALAESIEISSDSKEYLFHLRLSFWNDGTPLSAYDFEYAWKKILSPNFKTAFAYLFYPIKNAKKIKEGILSPEHLGIHSLNDRTLKVELEYPASYFLKLTAHSLYSPIHRLVDQQFPQWPYQCEKHFPCNGPFQLKVNQPNHGYQLVKNPFYWEAHHVEVDEIRYKVMRPFEAVRAFHKKEIDWIGNPFGLFDSSYKAGNDSQIISLGRTSVFWFVMNTSYKPLHHPKLRQAFAYAIQRAQFAIEPLCFEPAYSIFPPYKNQQFLFPDYDKFKARQLFQEALQELGMSKEDIPSLNLLCSDLGIQKHVALCLKKQFKEILDVECNPKPASWNQQFSKMISGDFQIGLMAWTTNVDDPFYTLNIFSSTKQELNLSKWEHPDFSQFINMSEQEINPFKRSYYFLKAEEILSKEMPLIPLFYRNAQALVTKDFSLFNKSFSCGSFSLANFFSKKEN